MTKEEKEKLLAQARKDFKALYDMDRHNKEMFVENIKFSYDIEEGAWNADTVTERDEEGRPHLSMNKFAKFVALVVNSEKGESNVDDIIPVDDKADVAVAKIYNEIINDIEYRSDAEDVYSNAAEHAVAGNHGYWRILTKYCDDSFDQELFIEKINNPGMVYVCPTGNRAFIREVLSKDDFESNYPKVESESVVDFESFAGFDDNELWYEDDKIFIAEYFRKEPVEKELVEFKNMDGETIVAERTKENSAILDAMDILRTRKFNSYKIKWYKITGNDVLEEAEWPGKEIPIIEVVGHSIQLNGKIYKRALISDGKDAMRMYNYWITSLTEKVALIPKAPYMVTSQMIKGYEAYWNEANKKNFPYLFYNPTGQGTPQRQDPPMVDNGALTMLNLANNDIKDTLGMYESTLGMPSNERSAKAITARNARSDLGTYTFHDNFRKAKQRTKKQLIDLIPKIYDNERVIRLHGSNEIVKINQSAIDGRGNTVIINDLNRGRYDLRAKSNISPSRRQQTVENISQAMQYAGNFAPLLLPLLMQNLDAPGSLEISAVLTQAIQGQMQQNAQGQGAPTK